VGCPCHGFFGEIQLCPAASVPGSKHPPWSAPAPERGLFKGLMVNNSLTGTLEPFRPAHGNQVLWYTCGPTVYDACHMGHARAYLTLDILRRIMEDWFGYDVVYHVNITDVDDKIILRARQEHLFKEWRSQAMDNEAKTAGQVLAHVLGESDAAMERKAAKLAKSRKQLQVPLPHGAGSREVEDHEAAVKGQELKEAQLAETTGKLQELKAKASAVKEEGALRELASSAVSLCTSELGELVDARKGSSVEEHAVFDAHSSKFELAFFEDMEALGVRPPDVVTRVTEYVGRIAKFVETIVDKGLAYEANGSVYLSIDAFKAAGHSYRKLKPFAGDTSEADMAEGEGAIGDASAAHKKHKNDFALWKASKPGEPWWTSRWGKGRPGWHIECSVIASDILGPNLDVHAGGVDLKFPHHDNELAQSEAFYGHSQWVNYFFHAGHLDIKGLKMSKSLKNFITIRQALEKHSARQIRLMFLLQPWDKNMNYSDQTVADAKAKEALFRNFFGSVKAKLAESASAEAGEGAPSLLPGKQGGPKWLAEAVGWRNGPAHQWDAARSSGSADAQLCKAVSACSDAVHAALARNFDTPAALQALIGLVKEVNSYLAWCEATCAVPLLRKACALVTKVLKCLGVVEGADDLGFPLDLGGGKGGSSEGGLKPYLDTFRDFRHEVRGLMRGKDAAAASGAVLAACDKVRDETLPKLGVRLEDLGDGSSRWKLDDPEVLLREMEERRERALAAAREKSAKKLAAAQKKHSDALQHAVPPAELLPSTKAKDFLEFDGQGLPTKDAKGEPVTKSALSKLKKMVETHRKAHDKLLAAAAKEGCSVEQLIQAYAAAVVALEAENQ